MAKAWLELIRSHAPPLNFITLHYSYFIVTCLLSGIVFWASATPLHSVSFTDALFLTVSAMTEAGLNTINLSILNTFQQILLFLLIIMGSQVGVSAIVVYIRRRAFEKRFTNIVEENRKARMSRVRSFDIVNRTRAWSTSKTRTRDRTQVEITRASAVPEVDGIVMRGRPIPLSNVVRSGDTSDVTHDLENAYAHVDNEQHDDASEQSRIGRPQGYSSSTSAIPGDFHIANAEDDSRSHINPTTSPGRSALRFVETKNFRDQDHSSSLASPPMLDTPTAASPRRLRLLSMSGVGAKPDLLNHPRNASTPLQINTNSKLPHQGRDFKVWSRSGLDEYLTGITGRNSQFSSLSSADRERLGGVEYRALRLLEILISCYFILFQFFGCIGVGAWTALNARDTAAANGLNPFWVGAFNAVSAFNNSGMSLLDANMVAFQDSPYVLLTMSLLILAGNTCYPIFLRLICWCAWKLVPATEAWVDTKVALRFVLDHPRRVYTNLFPAYHNYFLLASVFILNAVDWVAFEILNIGNPYVESLPSNVRVLDGLFQAFAVRSGGFYVVPIANIAIGVQILYVLMMYISVYPVSMTMRNSNIYEERSLGIYDTSKVSETSGLSVEHQTSRRGKLAPLRRHLTNATLFAETGSRSRSYFFRQQIRSQLAHDLWWICLAVWLITIIEGSNFATDPINYSVFNIIFEIVSAYGTVGISIGLPNVAYSFCGGWHILSKLILCAVMLRGRHRGLPVAIDRAVLLPHESLGHAEEEDARIRANGTTEQPIVLLSPHPYGG